jgi:hypothetical protein
MRYPKWAALILFGAAWLLLLYKLNEVPPGLQHDQVFDAVDAQRVLEGQFPIYFPANFGRNPAFIYSVAALFKLTQGHWVWSIRFASALWAMAGLALTLAFARLYLRPAAALFAAALMGGSLWFVFVGRLGLEPVSLLPLALAFLYLLARALRRPSIAVFALAGVFGGLANYAYLAARLLYALPVLLALHAGVVWLISNRDAQAARRLAGLLASLLVMLAVSAPLLLHLQAHPAQADSRISELSGPVLAAARGEVGPLLRNAVDGLRAVAWRGSTMLPYQYNLPGRAALQPVWAVLFVIGLAATLPRLRNPRKFLLLAALGLGLAPSLLTGGDALAMRGMVALPLLFILAARGAEVLCGIARHLLKAPASRGVVTRGAAAALAVALLLWHYTDGANAYFNQWAQAEPTQRIYNADFRLAARAPGAQAGDDIFIGTDRLTDLDSVTYAWYEPARPDAQFFRLPANPPIPAARPATYYGPTTAPLPPVLAALVAAGAERTEIQNSQGRPLVWRVRARPETVSAVSANLRALAEPVEYEGALRLNAVGWQEGDGGPRLLTRWTALGSWPHAPRPGMPLLQPKLSLALLDASGYTWSQVDAAAALPVHDMRSGQSLLELTPFAVPADMPPGNYDLRVVLYDDEGGPLLIKRGASAPGGSPIVATLPVPLRKDEGAVIPPYEVRAGDGALIPLGRWEPLDALLAGVPTAVHVSWRAARDTPVDGLTFSVTGYDRSGVALWEQVEPLAAGLPDVWPAGRSFRLEHQLQPEGVLPGQTPVKLTVCARRSGATFGCADIAETTVINTPAVMALSAPPQVAVNAQWADVVSLVGYDLQRQPGEAALTLYWQAAGPSPTPLKRFVHLVDSGDAIVAQSDAPLENGGRLVTAWRAGEYVTERISLAAPGGAQDYSVCIGLYEPATGARLPVSIAGGASLPDNRLCFQ